MKHWWDYVQGSLTHESAKAGFEKYCASTRSKLNTVHFLFERDNKKDFVNALSKFNLVTANNFKLGNIDGKTDIVFNSVSDDRYYTTHTYLEITSETIFKSIRHTMDTQRSNISIKANEKAMESFGMSFKPSKPMPIPKTATTLDVKILSLNKTLPQDIIKAYNRIITMKKALG